MGNLLLRYCVTGRRTAFYRSSARRTGIPARIPQLKSALVSDKTCWANPLAPHARHGWGGGVMSRDTGTTSASVARILGLWVLLVLGQLKYREDSPNVANGPQLSVEWVGTT